MIISSQGEVCSPNDDIKALDMHGTNALRDRLLEIQASTGGGEDALLAGVEIELGAEQEKLAKIEQEKQHKIEQEKQHKIEQAKQALQDFRSYLAQCSGRAAQALPSEEELEYSYNSETQECEITRLDGQDIKLDLYRSNLQGELPLPPQLMVTELYCAWNKLTALPELPASLTALYCWGNQLTALPELPDSLTLLACGKNQLTALPELPESLTDLYCEHNQLTTLPELPSSLICLKCNHNQLTALPHLPDSLTRLVCGENPSLARKRATKRILKAFRERGGQFS